MRKEMDWILGQWDIQGSFLRLYQSEARLIFQFVELVDMVYAALKGEEYVCYLSPDTLLPFAYVDDMISETVG